MRSSLLTGLLLIGLLILAGRAAAQPEIVVEPDTLFYSDTDDNNLVLVANTGNGSLRIDSLQFTPMGLNWWLDFIVPDTTYEDLTYGLGEFDGERFPRVSLAAQDTARIQLLGVSCGVCGSAARKADGAFADTLRVYSNDAAHSPTQVLIDLSEARLPVEEDVAPPQTLSVQVYPNPLQKQATVEFIASRVGTYHISVYDVLGRRIHYEKAFLRGGERWHRRMAFNPPLSGGIYFIRVSVGPLRVSTSFVVTQ